MVLRAGRAVSVSQSLCSRMLSMQQEVLRTSAPGNPIAPPMIPTISPPHLAPVAHVPRTAGWTQRLNGFHMLSLWAVVSWGEKGRRWLLP